MQFYGSRIGETPFYQEDALRARLASSRGVPVVYIKDESYNPSNTHKARVAASEILRHANGHGHTIYLTKITDGDVGEAVGSLAKYAPGNVKFASVVDKRTPRSIVKRLKQYGPVIKTDLDTYVNASRVAELVRKKTKDTNAVIIPIGGMDTDWSGYKAIAKELYESGVRRNYRIFIPVGGGDTMTNVVKGFEELGDVPQFVRATVPGNVYSSVPDDFNGGETKLHARHSGFQHDLDQLCDKYGFPTSTVTKKERDATLQFLRQIGVRAGSTAAVAFAAAEKYAHEHGFEDGENVVIINTGYEVPVIQSKTGKWLRYAAGLLAASVLIPINDHNNHRSQTMNQIRQETERYARESQKRDSLDVRYDDVKAFAEYRTTDTAERRSISNSLNMYVEGSDWHIVNALRNQNSNFRKLLEDFDDFQRVRHSLSRKNDEDIKYIREQVEQALKNKFWYSGMPGERGTGDTFVMDYLERDPSLNDKLAFAFWKTGGDTRSSEFVQIVSDLHWPTYGNIESMVCRDTPSCAGHFREYDGWKTKQAKNRDEMIRRSTEEWKKMDVSKQK